MSDRFGCTLHIGGKVNREVVEAILDDCPEELNIDEGTLRLYDPEAKYGHLGKLEVFLVSKQVPFLGESEQYYDYNGELYGFSEQVGELPSISTNGQGTITHDHRNILSDLESLTEMETITKDDLPLFLADKGIKKEYAEAILKGSDINKPLAFYLNKISEHGKHHVIPSNLTLEGTTAERLKAFYNEHGFDYSYGRDDLKKKAKEAFEKIWD